MPPHTSPRRPGRLLSLALALLVAFAAVLVIARPAGAGSYTVTQCSPAGRTADAGFERSSPHYRSRAHCEEGGAGLQVFHGAPASGLWHYGAWVWRAPPGTVFTQVRANASLAYGAGHRAQLIATRTNGEPVEFGSEHDRFRVHSIGGQFRQFHAWLRCVAPASGRSCGRAAEDSAHAYVRGVFLRTADLTAPSLTLTGGSALADPVVRGARGLTLAAADAGGGVRALSLRANGTVLGADLRNCALSGEFATSLRPCPAHTSGSFAVPTGHPAFATGPNEITVCAADLALDGIPNSACRRRTIWVDNACPASAVGGGIRIEARIAPGRERVRSDQRGLVLGRVAGAGGGATVCALSRTKLGGTPIVVAATATTAANGSFALELPPGPNRDLFIHRAAGDRVLARHGLEIRSRVRPALRVRPNRRVRRRARLRFSGSLPGPACAGRLVKIQARLGRGRWQVFRTNRTDASCAFDAGYRLRATRAARAYRFRALVPQQSGYPFERGRSQIARVTIRR